MTRSHKIERTERHTTYIGTHRILSLFSIAGITIRCMDKNTLTMVKQFLSVPAKPKQTGLGGHNLESVTLKC